MSTHRNPGKMRRCRLFLAVAALAPAFSPALPAQLITNLHQLTAALNSGQKVNAGIQIDGVVCAASSPRTGVLILKDETGVELLQVGDWGREILPGERIRISHQSCLLRKREMGIQITAMPVVDNDGLHGALAKTAWVDLNSGMIPLRVDWFNYRRGVTLDVLWADGNGSLTPLPPSNLWHAVVTETGITNLMPGLRADCYEGLWEFLPNFDSLRPVKTAEVGNFDLGIRPRAEMVAIRYSGFLQVPQASRHRFSLRSDDGAMLFLGDPSVPLIKLGQATVPAPIPTQLSGVNFNDSNERRWTVVEGRVNFASRTAGSLELELGGDRQNIFVRIADAAGLNVAQLVNARVRVQGVGRPKMTLGQTLVLGEINAASVQDLLVIERPFGRTDSGFPLTSVDQVQNLPIENARNSVPVRIKGIVTGGVSASQEHWMSFQDDSRGIFVSMNAVSNAVPRVGELWEVEGHSGAGDFAPIVIASRATRLGEGLLPDPIKPTWTELLNGSRDVQWAELKGLVSAVHSNTISLQLPEGRLDVELEGRFESELLPLQKAVVRIRGVLYASWDAVTREVQIGHVMMRNATLCVDIPPPKDPFDAVLKTPRELLLFDAQASAFRPVKVRGQVVYADSQKVFLEQDGTGLRLQPIAEANVEPGDLIEAVGYPGIGRTELLLREAQLRKTGNAPLPEPRAPKELNPSKDNLNLTRVRIEGRLLGWHVEQGVPVLEMQSGASLFLARLARGATEAVSIRAGSRLALVGVLVGHPSNPPADATKEPFELLLHSLSDISILSQPSWWTLRRLLAVVGLLLVVLSITVVWNTQLRRLVEQRTGELQHEIRERERLEHKHALEAERSRIARDLHDDLGSSLTEISVLASSGQLPLTSNDSRPGLFQAIGAKARSLISALDGIVWAVDPEDNSLQSLADYLSGYTEEYFSQTNISCRFKVPMSFPPLTVEGRVRHELLMMVKEVLNNIVRHAHASEVEFRMAIAADRLEIDIADNGKGIDDDTHNPGHGLKNLSARLQKLGGTCTVESGINQGTSAKIRLPIRGFTEARPETTDSN